MGLQVPVVTKSSNFRMLPLDIRVTYDLPSTSTLAE